YRDVQAAFRTFIERYNDGRPFVLAGVEQGGELADRLLREEIAANPALLERMAGAYFIDTVVPAEAYAPGSAVPACTARRQARCVVAWAAALEGDLEREHALRARSLAWDERGRLQDLDER